MIKTFIDESGSFVSAASPGYWNVTAAFSVPGLELKQCRKALQRLKIAVGKTVHDEVKLRDVPEDMYIRFVMELSASSGTLYAVAADGGQQTEIDILDHRDSQAANIEKNVKRMRYPEVKAMIQELADQISSLSAQLHLQLICQSELIFDVVNKAILFYVQRCPSQLNSFQWTIDEKAPGTNNFQQVFRNILPGLLQSKSIENPLPHVTEFDYSAMERYQYSEENAPAYLKEDYGLDIEVAGSLDIGRLVWEELDFVDSKDVIGVQIVDLLASGVRRCLRGEFQDNDQVSFQLGSLMVQSGRDAYPLRFVTVAGTDREPDRISNRAANIMKQAQKGMLAS